MARHRPLLFGLAAVLLVVSFAQWHLLQADFIWRWAAQKLVSLAQSQINGTIKVEHIEGGPISGLIFHNVTVATPQEEVLRLKRLEISLSPWSLLKLQPVIGKLVLAEPHLFLKQDQTGRWNVSQLIAAEEEPALKTAFVPFRSLALQKILVIDGEVVVERGSQKSRFHNLALDLALHLDHLLKPEQTLTISRALGAVTAPQGRFSLETRLTYGKSVLDLATLTLRSDLERYLSLTGKANLADKPGDIQFQGELGPVKGKTMGKFWSKWPEGGDVSGTLQVRGTLEQVHVKGSGNIHQAPYTITGVLAQKAGKWHYNAALDLTGLTPEILTSFFPSLPEKGEEVSPVSLHLRAEGVGFGWPPEQFAYSVEAEPFTYGRARVEQGKVRAEGNGRKQTIEAMLRGNFGEVSFSGSGSFFTAPAGEIKLLAQSLRPDLLDLGAPEVSRLDARFAGSFQLPDYASLDRLKVMGELEASGQVGEHPLRELKGRLAWHKPDLTIPFLRLHVGNMRAELKGSLAGGRLDFSFTGTSTPEGSWPIPAALEGQLNWKGALAGPISDPVFSFRANGRGLGYEGYGIQSFTLTARGTGWPPHSGAIDFQGTRLRTPAGVFSQASGRGATEGEQWRFRFDATSPRGPQVELAGSAFFTERPLKVVLDSARFRVRNVSGQNRGPVRFRFLPGFELQPATLVINNGTVTMEARLVGGEATGRLAMNNIPLEGSRLENLQGKLHGEFILAGSMNSPVIQGALRLERARWRNLAFPVVRTSLNYRESSLNISGNLEEEASGARAQWEGRLPLVLSFSPFRLAVPDEDMSLRLRGEEMNLGFLANFTQEVEEAEAPLDFSANVQGTWSKPRVSGELTWGGGFVRLRQAGARYRLEPGTISLQGNRVFIPRLTLVSGGTATLRGEVRLTGFAPDEVRAQAQFANFKGLDRLRSQAFLVGDVTIDGPWKALAVRGRLTIPRATLTPQVLKIGEGAEMNPDVILVRHEKKAVKEEEPFAAKPEFIKAMRIAVTVDAPGDVWVRDKQAEVELTLAIRINKRPGEPLAVGGQIRSLRGDLNIQGRDFKLVRGFVDLSELPGREPYIQARAVHETWDATIIMDVSGTPKRPHIELSSEPSLPKSEILSYLAFGRPSSALSKEEFSASKLAGGALGGITAQKILEILGPDFPLLGDVTFRSGQQIGIVKPLTKGLTVSLGRATGPVGEEKGFQAQWQYRVNRNISIEAQTGANPGGDVFFNYDF